MGMGLSLDQLQPWIGKQESRTDVISPAPVRGMSATLDYVEPRAVMGEPLPLPWHWLYFLPTAATSAVDTDGHPKRGDFLPPVPLPRRMWAGSNIRVASQLYVGDEVRRVSTIADISHKQGRSGELVFVCVQHSIFRGTELAIEEEQTLVYRQAGTAAALPAKPAPARAQWSRQIQPDPVLLFRYSALTFNSHRIHYDRDYAMGQEGYAGLVVQGPLTATLLLDLLQREIPGEQVATFQFRSIRPLLEAQPFQLEGCRDAHSVRLWALDGSGALAMDAQALLAH
jgi:3-methylfumaryl-CoA hydratase